jgi:hypothetical protein
MRTENSTRELRRVFLRAHAIVWAGKAVLSSIVAFFCSSEYVMFFPAIENRYWRTLASVSAIPSKQASGLPAARISLQSAEGAQCFRGSKQITKRRPWLAFSLAATLHASYQQPPDTRYGNRAIVWIEFCRIVSLVHMLPFLDQAAKLTIKLISGLFT